jgi:hypothetical protein
VIGAPRDVHRTSLATPVCMLSFMSRRLEDRIRELCAQAVVTTDLSELDVILKQLRPALREHIELLRKLAAERHIPPQRRASQ